MMKAYWLIKEKAEIVRVDLFTIKQIDVIQDSNWNKTVVAKIKCTKIQF